MNNQLNDLSANVMVKKKNKPKRSGYNQKFRHNIYLNDYGVPAELLDWCRRCSKGKWGWWFRDPEGYTDDWQWYPEQCEAYISFQYKKDALYFWFWWQRNFSTHEEK